MTPRSERNDARLRELHSIAMQLAPEIRPDWLRVFRHMDCWSARDGVQAYSITGKCIAIRDTLRACGEWPGFWAWSIVFVEEPTLPIFLHEVAHGLPIEPPAIDTGLEPTAEQRAKQVTDSLLPDDHEPLVGPWAGHAAIWIRRALHLHWRAWEAGYEPGLADMQVADFTYRLSPAWRYKIAIADEPARLAGESFATIDETPFPEEFIQLFRDDVKKYYLENPPRKEQPCLQTTTQ